MHCARDGSKLSELAPKKIIGVAGNPWNTPTTPSRDHHDHHAQMQFNSTCTHIIELE